jgi:predicted phosphodiesterase
MRSAIVSDIHADRPAFEAVLADIATRDIDRIVLLGDYLGYGADSDWVLGRVQDLVALGAVALRGNHDRTQPALHISPAARRVIDKTVNRLTARQKLFLDQLPLTLRDGPMLFAHASAHDPQDWHELRDTAAARQCFDATDAALICVGHTHRPALYCQDDQGHLDRRPIDLGRAISLSPQRRWLAVVGPVSQPRDGRIGAQYCIYDSRAHSICYLCLPHDGAERAQKTGFSRFWERR